MLFFVFFVVFFVFLFFFLLFFLFLCVCVCVCACVRACVRVYLFISFVYVSIHLFYCWPGPKKTKIFIPKLHPLSKHFMENPSKILNICVPKYCGHHLAS